MGERQAALLQALGQRLFNARVAAGQTVRTAARQIGIDHSMIVRYENGQSLPPLDRLIALAAIYGTTPSALLASNEAVMPLITAIEQADAALLTQLITALERAHEAP